MPRSVSLLSSPSPTPVVRRRRPPEGHALERFVPWAANEDDLGLVRDAGLAGSRPQRGRAHHETVVSAGMARLAKHDSTWFSASPGS